MIRAAKIPDTPTLVSTEVDLSLKLVKVQWTAPYDGGSSIFQYDVQIKQSDGVTYTQDSVNCPGDGDELTTYECLIPYSALVGAPWNLPWGSSIDVKVAAVNLVGTSLYEPGTGAVIYSQPD